MKYFPLHNIRKSIDNQWQQIHYQETRTIPSSANNIVELIEVPDDGTISSRLSIQNFTETSTYPPPSGQYYVNFNTGHIAFNNNDAGTNVDIDYYAKGSLVEVDDINQLYYDITDLQKLYTISNTPPVSANVGYQWYNTVDNILYIKDNNRNKWLSTDKQTLSFGKKGLTNNQYLRYFGGVIPSNKNSLRVVRNACIVSLSAQFHNLGTGTFYIRKNNTNTTITSLDVINDYGNGDTNINIDVDEGDVLQCYFDSPSSSIKDPIITIELSWRY